MLINNWNRKSYIGFEYRYMKYPFSVYLVGIVLLATLPVNSVGELNDIDEEMIKKYLAHQEKEEKKEEGQQISFDF